MSAKANNFKLGLFTLFGVGLLGTGVLAFGTWSSFEKKSLYETYVPGDVSGLSVGSAVEFRGVRVGKVTHIGFSWTEYQDSQPGCVVVAFEMRDDVFVTPLGSHWKEQLQAAIDRGLRARLKAQGVTGTCIVSFEYLDPAEYPVMKYAWTPKYTFVPSAPGLFGVLLESLHKSLIRLDHLDVSALTKLAETDLKSIGRVLDRVEKVDFENLSTNITALMQDIRRSSVKLNSFIDDTDDTVKKLQLEKLSKDADALVLELQGTIAKLEPGLTSVDFESINQTLLKARQTIQHMDDVLNELKEYPSGFIFGKPPPRLKEVTPGNQ
ncbi:MAG TPA: MlaD family protein [Candidatus Cybelea sp.]|jgi:paraquat-inducible protein B|nr:MlaD family protein [Candidatus Cybelea sp.]